MKVQMAHHYSARRLWDWWSHGPLPSCVGNVVQLPYPEQCTFCITSTVIALATLKLGSAITILSTWQGQQLWQRLATSDVDKASWEDQMLSDLLFMDHVICIPESLTLRLYSPIMHQVASRARWASLVMCLSGVQRFMTGEATQDGSSRILPLLPYKLQGCST